MAMKQAAEAGVPTVVEKRKAAPPPKAAVALTQKQQLMLVIGVVAVVLVGFLALIFWPSSKSAVRSSSASASIEATPEEIQQVMQKLEQNDPELAGLISSFAEDWAATGAGKNPASAVAEKLRAAQNAAVQAKARDRLEAARRAEIVAGELAKLKGAPSMKALKQAAER
jgi:multidrug efflux pump subunit AcrB